MTRAVTPLLCLLLALLVGSCGDGDGDADSPGDGGAASALTVWILESEPDRLRAMKDNVARFSRQSGIEVDVVGIGDDELAERMAEASRSGSVPDAVQLPIASAHAYARSGLLSRAAAQDVVDRLGEDTFSARALSLATAEGSVTAVPSDGWGQLLIYRKDLFAAAGLPAPRSLDDVRRAARRLHRGIMAGIALPSERGPFTGEVFEHVALAAGCQLLDESGRVTLDSEECVYAFSVYLELARRAFPGLQDVDTTRDTYFAGRAAMLLWSPFLLDAMAGLRDDAAPTCPQCADDPAYLARNSGLVGALSGPGGASAQYGSVSTWGIAADGDVANAQRFVTYMLSEGYVRWLALSPQGKYPVRFGDRAEPERYVEAWTGLESGVERKAPLRRFYSDRAIDAIGDGARSFQRWGFEQGGAALVGAMRGPEPIAAALAEAIATDGDASRAARRAQSAVERLQRELK